MSRSLSWLILRRSVMQTIGLLNYRFTPLTADGFCGSDLLSLWMMDWSVHYQDIHLPVGIAYNDLTMLTLWEQAVVWLVCQVPSWIYYRSPTLAPSQINTKSWIKCQPLSKDLATKAATLSRSLWHQTTLPLHYPVSLHTRLNIEWWPAVKCTKTKKGDKQGKKTW